MASDIRVFSCPSCNETINTSMLECAYCHVPVDAQAAANAAEQMARINQACSDASYLKIMTGAMLTFFLLRFVPFIALLGTAGLLFLIVAIPVMAIRWQRNFGSIVTTDPEFLRAKKTVKYTAIASALFFVASAVIIGIALKD